MSTSLIPRRAVWSGELALALFEAVGRATALKIKRARRLAGRGPVGYTLRPGPKTPLWNEMVRQAAAFLGKRGSKARLARFLGLPRQRLQDCLKARRATLDAERTLLLLCWVAARQQGRDLIV